MYYRGLQRLVNLARQHFKANNELFYRTRYSEITSSVFQVHRISIKQYSSENVDKEKNIVYKGPLTRQIVRVKLFSLISSLTGVIFQPMVYFRAEELGASTSTMVLVISIVGFFTFVTPLLLHLITRKYVVEVLHKPEDDMYIAATYSLFLMRKEVQVKPGEGTLPEVAGMFTTLTVRDIPLFIDAAHFSDVYHYKRIMGFDRPLNFHLKTDSDSTNKES